MQNFRFLNKILADPIRVKFVKLFFSSSIFVACPKIRDWIQKYIQIHHGF